MDRLSCPICHSKGIHKMDCPNGAYVYQLRKRLDHRIAELEAEVKRQVNHGWDLTEKLERMLTVLRYKVSIPAAVRDELLAEFDTAPGDE